MSPGALIRILSRSTGAVSVKPGIFLQTPSMENLKKSGSSLSEDKDCIVAAIKGMLERTAMGPTELVQKPINISLNSNKPEIKAKDTNPSMSIKVWPFTSFVSLI